MMIACGECLACEALRTPICGFRTSFHLYYLTNYHFTLIGGDFLPFLDSLYKHDVCFLKVLGCGDYKQIRVVSMKTCRTSGLEVDDSQVHFSSSGGSNDFKLQDNICRAKTKIYELALCNQWQWFFTGTLDKSKYDRSDLNKFHHDLTHWLRNYSRKLDSRIQFLLIPELHSDGVSWHIHGFLMGLPVDHLRRFVVGDRMGKGLADKVLRGDVVYSWGAYSDKFGFCDLEPIRNPEAAAKYVTKYISKNLFHSVTDLGAHLYYRSRGLAEAVLVKKGIMKSGSPFLEKPQFENDYCGISSYPYSEEMLAHLSEFIL